MLAVLKCAGYYAIYMLITLLSTGVLGAVIGISGTTEDTAALVEKNSITLTLLANAAFVLVVAIFYNNKGQSSSFGKRIQVAPIHQRMKTYILGLAVGAIMAVQVVNIIPFPTPWIEMAMKNSETFVSATPVIQFLTIVIMAPLTEEILFRGLMLGALSKTCNKWLAIVATAIVFGIVHGHPIGIIYASCLGLVLGWLYIKTGSIIAPILFHGIYNFASLFFPVPGTFIGVLLFALTGFGIGAVCIVNIAKLPAIKKKSENSDNSEDLK